MGVVAVDLPLLVSDGMPGEEPDGEAGGQPGKTGKHGESGGELLAVASVGLEEELGEFAVTGGGCRDARSGPGGKPVAELLRGQVVLEAQCLVVRRGRPRHQIVGKPHEPRGNRARQLQVGRIREVN